MDPGAEGVPVELIPRRRLIRGLAASVVLTVLGLAALYHFTSGSDAPRVPAGLHGGFLVLALLSATTDLLIGAVRYQIFLRRIRPGTSIRLPIRADLANRFLGAVTPSQTGGGPAQLFVLWRGGIPIPDALSFLLINFLSTLVFFLLAGGFTAWIFRERFPDGAIHMLVQYGFVAFVVCLLVILVGLFRPDWLALPLAWSARRLEGRAGTPARITRGCCSALAGSVEQYRAACVRFIRENPALPVLSFMLTLLLYLNKFTLAWLVMRGLGAQGDYLTTVAVQALLQFILFVAPSPGGSGIAEIGTGALMAIVLPGHLLAPFTLVYRFLLQYLPATLGGLVLLREMGPAHGHTRPIRVKEGPGVQGAAAGARAAAVAKLPVALVLGLLSMHVGAAAQETTVARPCHCPESVAAAMHLRDLLARGLIASDRDSEKRMFRESVECARALVAAEPADPDAHYLLAAALGYQMGHERIRKKLRIAGEVRAEAERALELDPTHAGAHHVMGRLHAAAMRLNPIARLVARKILGASALEGASWDQAEHHFREAWRREPTSPRHPMELGALYIDTGRPEMAGRVLLDATACQPGEAPDSLASIRAKTLLARLAAR